eukprot:gene1052-1596_t
MFGKSILVPRRQGLFSEHDTTYKFSGMSIHNEPITSHPFIENILDQVSSTHNAVFVNWYESGQDSVGLHSDDEKQLVPGSCIISVSFNATRTFRVKKKPTCDHLVDKIDFRLSDGAFQKEFQHEVPKNAKMIGDARRINFTIRSFALQNKRKRCHVHLNNPPT